VSSGAHGAGGLRCGPTFAIKEPSMLGRHHKHYNHLRSVPLFSDLSDHELEEVGKAATELHFEAGNQFIREGSVAHEMFVVAEGTVEVTRGGTHVADVGPGGFIGELALLTQAPRGGSVRAKTDATLIHIDGRQFNVLLKEVPQIAVKMLPIVARRAVAPAADSELH
jgi:CRP-like cAMP-binding protein